MATLPQRIARFFSSLGGRISGIAGSTRGPEESRVANLPQLPQNAGYQSPKDQRTADMLRLWEAYGSRISPLAGPMKDRFSLWNATDLTPQIITSAQYAAVSSGLPLQWVELIDHVFSRDIDYASVTSQRVADVMRGRWTFRRNGNDDAAAVALAFCEEAQRGCHRWRDGLEWLLYANLYSYNAIEIEWKIDRITFNVGKKRIGPVEVAIPRRLHNVHPKHFRFDIATDDPLFYIGNGFQTLPIGKFVFMEGDGQHPIKVRHGHAWQCIWMSLFTSIGISGWAQFVDRFGMPIPKIEYDSDVATFTEQMATIDDILNALGSAKGVKYPKGQFELDFINPPQGGRSSDPHSAFWDACKTAKVVRVLGAELANATGNVGSYAAKSQDIATKYNLEDRDAARVEERITEQLTAPMMLFNAENIATAANAAGFNITPDQLIRRVPFGRQPVPRDMTPPVRAEVLGKLVSVGMPISMRAEFDEFPFARAIDDDDRIPGEAVTVGAGAALKTPADAASGDSMVPDPEGDARAKAIESGAMSPDGRSVKKGGGDDSGSTPPVAPPPSP